VTLVDSGGGGRSGSDDEEPSAERLTRPVSAPLVRENKKQ
jgi:hypothetical protein